MSGRWLHSAVVALVLVVAPAEAFSVDVSIDGVSVGFANRYKAGFWTPIAVTVSAGASSLSGRWELVLLDGDGVPATVPAGNLKLAPGETRSVVGYAKTGRSRSPIRVTIRDNDSAIVAEREFSGEELPAALAATQELIVEVGAGLDLERVGRLIEQAEHERIATATLTDAAALPRKWYGYEGVDLVVLSTSRLTSPSAVDGDQAAALDLWIRQGGRLILCAGKSAPDVLAAGTPLARFVPGVFAGMTTLKRPAVFEDYAGAADRLDAGAARGRPEMEVPLLHDVRGRIEAYAGNRRRDLPLIVRAPHGFGEVVFVAADLDQPPFDRWPARDKLLARLLNRDTSLTAAGGAAEGTAHLGYNDLSGQLRGALDQFAGVEVIPFWMVALLAVAYIVILFPLEYYLVCLRLERPRLTWLVFPLTLAVFGGGAWLLALRAKGDRLQVNRVDVVDFDAESGLTRGTTWFSLFSPSTAAFDLRLRPATAGSQNEPADVLMSWQGLPGVGLGGLSAAAESSSSFVDEYSFSPRLDELLGVPLATWSSKSLIARWRSSSAPMNPAAAIQGGLIETPEKLLAGEFQSPLDVTLANCMLLYDRWAYPLGTIGPRERRRIDAELDPITADTWLTRRGATDNRGQPTPYNRAGLDAGRILEMLLFHEAAGGKRYTGLSHRYQHTLDLSDHLMLGRAIIVGQGPVVGDLELNGVPAEGSAAADSSLDSNGATTSGSAPPADANKYPTDGVWRAIYRIVLPVQRAD